MAMMVKRASSQMMAARNKVASKMVVSMETQSNWHAWQNSRHLFAGSWLS